MQQPANPHPIFLNSRLPLPIHALYLGGMRAFCAAQVSCLLGGFGRGLFLSHDYGPLTHPRNLPFMHFVLEALGVGYFLKRLLTSHPPRNPPFVDFLLETLGVAYFF